MIIWVTFLFSFLPPVDAALVAQGNYREHPSQCKCLQKQEHLRLKLLYACFRSVVLRIVYKLILWAIQISILPQESQQPHFQRRAMFSEQFYFLQISLLLSLWFLRDFLSVTSLLHVDCVCQGLTHKRPQSLKKLPPEHLKDCQFRCLNETAREGIMLLTKGWWVD